MDELRLWFGVSTQPILVGEAVAIVVFSINVVFVKSIVAVLVNRVNRTVVHIVVLSSITRPRDQWARSAQRSTPFELIVAIQVHSIAAFIHFFIEVGKWRNAGYGVVSQILSPTSRRAIPSFFSGALAWHVDFTIVDVSINVQHWNEVNFSGVDKVGNPLLRVVLVNAVITRSAVGSVAV